MRAVRVAADVRRSEGAVMVSEDLEHFPRPIVTPPRHIMTIRRNEVGVELGAHLLGRSG
jgi:hypothetical protein